MPTPTRERLVAETASLLRTEGYALPAWRRSSPWPGRHWARSQPHFPGGKVDLAAEAIRTSGGQSSALVPAIFDQAPDLLSGIRAFFAAAADHLVETDYADACPIATVALEVASTNETLRQATADVFDGWLDYGTPTSPAAVCPRSLARDLTLALVTALRACLCWTRPPGVPRPWCSLGSWSSPG